MHKTKKLFKCVLSCATVFSMATATLFNPLISNAEASENHIYSTAQTAAAGEEAHIPILIENNTGFVSFNIYLSYDPEIITPVAISVNESVLTNKGDVYDSIGGNLIGLPENTVQVTFTSSDYTNADEDGLMFDFICDINDEATGSTAIKVSYDEDPDITFNADDEVVVMACTDVNLSITNNVLDKLPSIEVSSDSTSAGESLNIDSSFTKKPEVFEDMKFELDYDKWSFSSPEITVYDGKLSNVLDNNGKLLFDITGADGKASKLFSIEFKVNDMAYEGNYTFKFAGSIGDTKLNISSLKVEVASEIKSASPIICGPDKIVGKTGEELIIPITIGRNRGLMGTILKFSFDSNILEIMSVESTKLLPGSLNNNIGVEKNNFIVRWSNIENTMAEGVFINLKFNVLDNSADNTIIGIDYSDEDTFDENYNDVSLICSDVTISLNESIETEISTTTTSTVTPTTTTTTASTTNPTETTTSTTSTIEPPVTTTEPKPVIPNDYELGDVNCDGVVDSTDASKILYAYAMMSTGGDDGLTEIQRMNADVNGDTFINSTDASKILAYYAFIQVGGTGSIEEFMANKFTD